jgi:ComF family protein
MRHILRDALNLIYPNSCLVCDAPEPDGAMLRHGLCIDCCRAVTVDPFDTCPWCAETVGPHTDTADGCLECRGASLGFDRAVRLGPYAGKLRDAVLRTKTLGGEGLADLLGRMFAEVRGEVLRAERVDLVTAVPLHWVRRLMRGYNQSAAIARELASGLGVPFSPHLVRRVRWTPQQVQPSRAARLENIKGAFRLTRRANLDGRTVLVVDDVLTTGATAGAVARVMKDGGAGRVVVAVLARRQRSGAT